MIGVKIDVSEQDGISFTHHQHPKDCPTVKLDLWHNDHAIGSLTLTRDQALELRTTLNEWAAFYGFLGDDLHAHRHCEPEEGMR